MWVSPFGYLRIDGYVLLPAAFRSLSRPSSAPGAKAFALRSFCLTCFRMYSVTHGWSVSFLKQFYLILEYLVLDFGRLKNYFHISLIVSVFGFQGTLYISTTSFRMIVFKESGIHLLSHIVSNIVPSAA